MPSLESFIYIIFFVSFRKDHMNVRYTKKVAFIQNVHRVCMGFESECGLLTGYVIIDTWLNLETVLLSDKQYLQMMPLHTI